MVFSNILHVSFSVKYPKRGVWGFACPDNVTREPICPVVTESKLLEIESTMPGGVLSAKARRRMFAVASENYYKKMGISHPKKGQCFQILEIMLVRNALL